MLVELEALHEMAIFVDKVRYVDIHEKISARFSKDGVSLLLDDEWTTPIAYRYISDNFKIYNQ